MSPTRFLRVGLTFGWLSVLVASAQQAPQDNPKPEDPKNASATNDPFSMDLDSLANTKVTTASKFSEDLADAPGVMTVVSKDELKRFGGFTLAEILSRVAGLTLTSDVFPDRTIIAVRGQQSSESGSHVLILINGRPVREIMEGGIDSDILESFPVNILERIEVIKGPGSVLYGSDAFYGVINLITKKAEGESVQVSAAGGANGATAASAEVLFQKGGVDVVAAAQYRQFPRWDLAYQFNPLSENATVGNEGDGGYLGIHYRGLSFMSSYTGLEASSFSSAVGNMRFKRGFGDLGYALKASAKWDMTFNLTYTRTILDTSGYPILHRDSDQTLLEWTNFITFSEKDRLTFGALYDQDRGTELFFAGGQNYIGAQGARSADGFYAQHEHKLTDTLKLIGGFQANKIGYIKLNVVPRGGILWNPAEHLTLKVLYGGAFRAPSLDEILLNIPVLKGNPDLSPEKVGTLDLQLSYQSNRVQASAGYFHSHQSALIVQDFTVFPGRYINLPSPATFQGGEAEGKFYLRRKWFLLGSMLYQVNTGHGGTSILSPIPDLGVKAGMSYLAGNGAALSLFDAYQGHTPGFAASPNPRPEAFHSVSAHARFELSKYWLKDSATGFALFLHADNLANNQVWLPVWSGGTRNTIPFSQGRTVFYGIEVWRKHD
jgi:outer membrane receptor for ferrienterochelin and colicin